MLVSMSLSTFDKSFIIDPFSTGYKSAYNPVVIKYETASVLDKYPITNKAYTKILYYDTYSNYNLNKYITLWRDVWDKDKVEVFSAELSSARYHKENHADKFTFNLKDGDVYDPWYRNITELKSEKYTHGNHKICDESFAPNGIEQSVIYQFDTTIDKVSVKILLYQNFLCGFFNKKKIENHYKSINPFSKKIGTNYDLVVTNYDL
jgi:hypothetical protein